MLVDEVELALRAGHGGPGKMSFFPGKKSGPDGGNGGRGGDVYVKATTDLTALKRFTSLHLLQAEKGEGGGKNNRYGAAGNDLEVLLPTGSVLIDDFGRVYELTHKDQTILICKGGLGGRGNAQLASSTRTTPEFAQPGMPGEVKHFKIHLKLIADFGLIGLPNAGKSSLLNELTKAQAKVGDYHFTTLEPNLGVLSPGVGSTEHGEENSISHLSPPTTDQLILADIPGLIEGASEGRGLGIKFLKHIEKVKVLLHCITAESTDIKKDYQTVRTELEKYNPELIQKSEIILLTKTDLVDKKELKEKIDIFKKMKKKVIPVSIHDWDSLEELKKNLMMDDRVWKVEI